MVPLGKFVKSLQADSATSHQPMDADSTTSFSEKPGDDARMTLSTISHPSAVNHTSLDTAHGITRSQELAIVTQVFSPYITSSDEQPRTQPAANSNNSGSSSGRSNPAATQQTPGSNPSHSQSQTHIRNASDDSASLPQSNDYQTVPGILPREISHLVPAPVPAPSSSTATASSSTTTNTSSGGHISLFTQAQRPGLVSPPINHSSVKTTTSSTPLQVGIAFGALPNVSSSSGSGSGGSAAPSPADPLYQVSPENRDTATTGVAVTGFGGGGAAAGLGSPNSSSKKHVDRPLRFGFGGR
ncbi:hypothetical protein QFC24_004719 [Naganishia onofrii]|uniref:Uncharacterized protein n=1 Tax=Naganishia onofrii TaxID=1851511 RepID=A0ACC2XDC7_9TREE|nr:hypothetical protein QFC24_004719 [Naganishia onofrii]